MSEKKIEPTDAMVASAHSAAVGRLMTDPMTYRRILRTALNHPDAAGLLAAEWKSNAEAAAERAERAEDLLVDAVHVDEAALRVEAAREQGWDDAAQHIYNKGWEGVTALRKANPHRPAPELPTEDGAVIVPADGHEFIWVEGGRYFDRLTYSSRTRRWYGPATNGGPAWAAFWYGDPDQITPGTWKVADQ